MEQEIPYTAHNIYKKIAASDQQAFCELFMLYKDHVFLLAIALLKSRPRAEDVTQEVFLKVWLNRAMLPSIVHFKAYLSTITRNHIYNSFRKMANEELFLHQLSQETHTENPVVLEQLDLEQLQTALFDAMKNLTNKQKQVFELSRIEGLNHDAIAKILHMKKVTVKKHMTDALKTIKIHLKAHRNLYFLLYIWGNL